MTPSRWCNLCYRIPLYEERFPNESMQCQLPRPPRGLPTLKMPKSHSILVVYKQTGLTCRFRLILYMLIFACTSTWKATCQSMGGFSIFSTLRGASSKRLHHSTSKADNDVFVYGEFKKVILVSFYFISCIQKSILYYLLWKPWATLIWLDTSGMVSISLQTDKYQCHLPCLYNPNPV